MGKFILASASPRRRELLKQIGLDFDVLVSDADEDKIDKNLPADLYTEELAMAKAAAAAAVVGGADKIIIAADTIVYFNGKILGKPSSEEEAFEILSELSGNVHEVYTGICVMRASDGFSVASCEKTKVYFKTLTEEKIKKYIASGEPMDKAGAYGIQGLGVLLTQKTDGDYSNVVGLPLSKFEDILKKEFGIDLL